MVIRVTVSPNIWKYIESLVLHIDYMFVKRCSGMLELMGQGTTENAGYVPLRY